MSELILQEHAIIDKTEDWASLTSNSRTPISKARMNFSTSNIHPTCDHNAGPPSSPSVTEEAKQESEEDTKKDQGRQKRTEIIKYERKREKENERKKERKKAPIAIAVVRPASSRLPG